MSQHDFPALSSRPSAADLQGDNHYAQLARNTWLKKNEPPKVRHETVKQELWDKLEKDNFAFGSLLILENLQTVEKYGTVL